MSFQKIYYGNKKSGVTDLKVISNNAGTEGMDWVFLETGQILKRFRLM